MSLRRVKQFPTGKYVVPKHIPKYLPMFYDYISWRESKPFEYMKQYLEMYWEDYHVTGKPAKPRKPRETKEQKQHGRDQESSNKDVGSGGGGVSSSGGGGGSANDDVVMTDAQDSSSGGGQNSPEQQQPTQQKQSESRKLKKVADDAYRSTMHALKRSGNMDADVRQGIDTLYSVLKQTLG